MPSGESSRQPADVAAGARRGRDRRGRGMRGPGLQPGSWAPDGVPAQRTRRERFDALALAAMEEIELRWPVQLATTELAVEEVPLLPDHWAAETVPLSTYVAASGRSPARLVLFRRPIEHRAEGRTDLEALVLTVLVEQVAEVLGIPPEEVHPGYQEG
ncbi:MAG TPA: metallopeptidase family protein [Marmoricola sp.]